MTDTTPTESQLTANDLATALRRCPASHIDLRVAAAYQDAEPITDERAALGMVRTYEPVDRYSVARFLVTLRGMTQEASFALIKDMIRRRVVIEVDGELVIPTEGERIPESVPWGVILASAIIGLFLALAIALVLS